jgi:hypothetical protein
MFIHGVVILVTALLCGCRRDSPPLVFGEPELPVSLPQYGLLELPFSHSGIYENPFHDVTLEAVFQPPGGGSRTIGGFYYGGGKWMIRFRPDLAGQWSYRYQFRNQSGFLKQGGGAFTVTASSAAGPLRRHPTNPYRWIHAQDKLFFPIGLQDCIDVSGAEPWMTIDGAMRHEGRGKIVYARDYFRIYGEAGFNLLRFSQRNCSHSLYETLDRYLERESLMTDQILQAAHDKGFRVMFGFFGYHGRFSGNSYPAKVFNFVKTRVIGPDEAINDPENAATLEREKRFIRYAVARWGVFTDFWELLNERHADARWINHMATFLRSLDPGKKPLSTSWQRPELPSIEINAPHWYVAEAETESDSTVRLMATKWKAHGKPVIVAEQGNAGMNWDPRSAIRMRIRLWTTLVEDIGFIFWNTSWAKNGVNNGVVTPDKASNIYLGPEERGYTQVLRQASSRLASDAQPLPVTVSEPAKVRAAGLQSSTAALIYLHHFASHSEHVSNLRITLPAKGGAATWINPANGHPTPAGPLRAGEVTLEVPPFLIDLALLIE